MSAQEADNAGNGQEMAGGDANGGQDTKGPDAVGKNRLLDDLSRR